MHAESRKSFYLESVWPALSGARLAVAFALVSVQLERLMSLHETLGKSVAPSEEGRAHMDGPKNLVDRQHF
jgi:hypothetical protein